MKLFTRLQIKLVGMPRLNRHTARQVRGWYLCGKQNYDDTSLRRRRICAKTNRVTDTHTYQNIISNTCIKYKYYIVRARYWSGLTEYSYTG